MTSVKGLQYDQSEDHTSFHPPRLRMTRPAVPHYCHLEDFCSCLYFNPFRIKNLPLLVQLHPLSFLFVPYSLIFFLILFSHLFLANDVDSNSNPLPQKKKLYSYGTSPVT
jgi:hypothetical protein